MKNEQKRLNTILYVSLELIRKISIMLYPIIPNSSLKVLKIFNISEREIQINSLNNHEFLKTSSKIGKISMLFKKIPLHPAVGVSRLTLFRAKPGTVA